MTTPATPLAGLTVADLVDYLNQSPGTAAGFTISALDAVVNPETELDGALHEVETPNGPAVNSYKNKKLTSEQLIAYLTAKLPGGGTQEAEPITYDQLRGRYATDGTIVQKWYRITQRTNSQPAAVVYFTNPSGGSGFGADNVATSTATSSWGWYDLATDAFVLQVGTGTPGTPGTDSSVADPVEYTAAAGQTSITSGQLPALSNATAILHIGNAASDGHLSPEFKERPTQASTDPGYWFDRSTHTLYFSAGLLDKAYTLSIKYATGVVGGGGGPTLTQMDLLDHTTDQMDEVMALSYDDNNDADPALSPAWGLPGMWFDGKDASGDVWRYTCGRSTYTPGVPGSGVGPCWSRVTKIKP